MPFRRKYEEFQLLNWPHFLSSESAGVGCRRGLGGAGGKRAVPRKRPELPPEVSQRVKEGRQGTSVASGFAGPKTAQSGPRGAIGLKGRMY